VPAGFPQHVQAIDLPVELQIGHHDIDALVAQHLDGMLARVDSQGFDDRQASQRLDDAVGMISLVIHDEND
jgi:hypothetical protein